jgi:hypothetical protein
MTRRWQLAVTADATIHINGPIATVTEPTRDIGDDFTPPHPTRTPITIILETPEAQ